MNIAIEEISACRRRLNIEIPAEDVARESERVLDEFQKFGTVRGFRPGKAPRKMIASRYRNEIESELKRKLVPQSFRQAIKEKNLEIVSSPIVEDLNFQAGSSLSFTTTVDLAPEFSLPDYKSVKIEAVDTNVTDEDVEKWLKDFADSRATYETVEGRAPVDGDMAIIQFSATIDGKPFKEAVAATQPEVAASTEGSPDQTSPADLADAELEYLEKGHQVWVKLGEDHFIPGMEKHVVGMNPGEQKSVSISFPDDFQVEGLRGKTALYEVTLSEVRAKNPLEINDAMAMEFFKVNLDEARTRIRKMLESEKAQSAREREMKQIVDSLLEKVDFELPESNVQEETQSILRSIVRENEMRGLTIDMLQQYQDQIINNAQSSAKQRVKMNYILARIAREEKIEATDAELFSEIQELSERVKIPVQKLFSRLYENGGILKLQDDIVNRKTMDFLLQSARSA